MSQSQTAPKSFRMHIGIFGRRNVGKSSLLNALTKQNVSIVSDMAGTTTDPVEKPMEMLPLGPVIFIDTAGLDDEGSIGALRIKQSRRVLDRTDFGIIVTDGDTWGQYEQSILTTLRNKETAVIIAFNKSDLGQPSEETLTFLRKEGVPYTILCATTGEGIEDFKEALTKTAPDSFIESPTILGDLVHSGELAIFVVPIDKEAPKGRLIMPQVQSIRDLLDSDAMALIVKERELSAALQKLKTPPKLIVTDSQAFLKVAADTPPDIPMTSFSILFARLKGDLVEQTKGAKAIDTLKAGDKILIAESCTHRQLCEDIGRIKIPRWLTQFVGGKLEIDVTQGYDFPEDLSPYSLVIHCGACMWNRRTMQSRIEQCCAANVPITNYGLAIAHSLGIMHRALEPFPAARAVYDE